MTVTISAVPVEIIILIIFLVINSVVLFIFIDKFYKTIKYKASFIYYIELFFNWDKIRNKMNNNKEAKKYFKVIIYLNIIFLVVCLLFFLKIMSIM